MHLGYPTQMNLELTTKCPMRCPQCYCALEGAKDLDFGRALEVLRDGAKNGLSEVNLSGGETMLYPRLYDLIEECSKLGLVSNIALSGYGVDGAALERLIGAGAGKIFVSLNGSTKEINSKTRSGYEYAVNALALLQKAGFARTAVNFVVHRTNCDDFFDMVDLCEKYEVCALVLMAAKPTSKNELDTLPTALQSKSLAENIKKARTHTKVRIEIESCYSPLKAYLGRSYLFGNTNVGLARGCGAGRDSVSLSVEGDFTPCRHLPFAEGHKTIGEYWENSEVLDRLRDIESSPGRPCGGCEFERYCLSCPAVGYKLDGKLEKANAHCFVR